MARGKSNGGYFFFGMRVEVWRKVRKDFMIEVKALKTVIGSG